MDTCQALKTDGRPCRRHGRPDGHPLTAHLRFCTMHWATYNRRVTVAGEHHQAGRCGHFFQGTRRRWCENAHEPGSVLCLSHRNAQYWRLGRQVARFIENAHRAPHPPGPPRPAVPLTLAALAGDAQNVHTQVVSEQTNRGIEVLLAVPRDPLLFSVSLKFMGHWLVLRCASSSTLDRVVADMDVMCMVETHDGLYRRLLDGLYTKIQRTEDGETRKELFRRAYEECFESVGMCFHGHVNRLCNVFVGFDERFAAPVPMGEILQQRIAAIAGLDVDTDEKVRRATAVFEELRVPDTERAAWLEAL